MNAQLQSQETPVMNSCFYNATSNNPWQLTGQAPWATSSPPVFGTVVEAADDHLRRARQSRELAALKQHLLQSSPLTVVGGQDEDNNDTTEGKTMATQRRIVQVFIADTDDNVPMDSAILYKGEPKFTDLTDQELYFELPIKELLEKHNTARGKFLDKAATKRAGKDIYLEPVKVRDLRMSVVNMATF